MDERIDEKEIVCITCPNSCRLTVWRDAKTNEVHVSGNQCPRGKDYGFNEYTLPIRMLITTMRIENAVLPVLPVRSVEAIPKEKLFEAIRIVNETSCVAPVKMGTVLVKNICKTGIDVIASRDMDAIAVADFCTDETEDSDPYIALHRVILQYIYNGATHVPEAEAAKLNLLENAIIEQLKRFGLKSKD